MADHSRPYGIGFSYRTDIHEDLLRHRHELDLLEIAAVDYTCRGWRVLQDPQETRLAEAVGTYPSIMHATTMSIGSVDPFDETDVNSTMQLMQRYGITDFSEHLTFHRMGETDIHSFMPMPFEEISLDWLARKYAAIRSRVTQPVGLENVSYLTSYPNPSMTEAKFLTELTKRTDCLLLLDVTNVFNNSQNFKYDAKDFIRQLPADRIQQLHIAGGRFVNDAWIDSHSEPVVKEVWELLEFTLKHTAAEIVILEKDVNYVPFGPVLKDLRIAREMFFRHRPKQAPARWEQSSTRLSAAEPVAAPNADDPQFAELRDFQRGLVRLLSDPTFRAKVDETPELLGQTYPHLSPVWQHKLLNCERRFFRSLYRSWREKEEQKVKRERDVAAMEWRAWANQS